MSSAETTIRGAARPRLPQVTVARDLEAASRRLFEEAVAPWLVTPWRDADFGIDAMVEITRVRSDTSNRDATGIRFAVQLKASSSDDILQGIRVKPGHVLYWCQNTEPVLLVVCHVPSRRLAYRWVDDSLLTELGHRDPGWMAHATVVIPFTSAIPLDASSAIHLERHASKDSRVRRPLAPGTFFKLQRSLASVAASIEGLALKAGFETVTGRIRELRVSLHAAAYVVAIAGPSRAGKSTLLNALVGSEITPVGRLPTTAVSLLIVAGAESHAEIEFRDGTSVCGTATAGSLEPYATQAGNPDNQKGVRSITITLVNEALERGVAYLDAPGLHDPSEDIRNVTEEALRHANSIVYVLDGAPARDGGFFLSRHTIDDLRRMMGLSRHVFLVINKIDVVPPDRAEELRKYVDGELAKYSVRERLAHAPIFMSAQAYAADRGAGGRSVEPPLGELEATLWTHLLGTRSTGLDRLTFALSEMERAGQDFQSLLAAKRADGAEAHGIRESLRKCKRTAGTLVARIAAATQRDIRDLFARLNAAGLAIQKETHERLAAIPLAVDLPPASAIREDTHKALLARASTVWQQAVASRELLAGEVRGKVEKVLRQARAAAGVPVHGQILVPSLALQELPADAVPQAWTGAFALGIVGLVFHPVFGLVGLLLGAIGGALVSRDERRGRRIAAIDERVAKGLSQAIDAIADQMVQRVRQHELDLRRHADDRVSVYVREMERQLADLGTPLSPPQQATLKALEDELRGYMSELGGVRVSMP